MLKVELGLRLGSSMGWLAAIAGILLLSSPCLAQDSGSPNANARQVGSGDSANQDLADQDAKKVMALMRLKSVDVNQKSALKEMVLRHLDRVQDTDQWLTLAQRFLIPETAERLVTIASSEEPPANVAMALAVLQQLKAMPQVYREIEATLAPLDPDQIPRDVPPPISKPADELAADIRVASRLANHLRLISQDSDAVVAWLRQQVLQADRYPQPVAIALVQSMVALPQGDAQLLELAQRDQLPPAIRLTVASELGKSKDAEIQEAAAGWFPLPKAADRVLAPVSELASRQGDPVAGQKIFAGVGTCAKCHVVAGQGSSVGPDLTEIGSKLARDAMYTAILDPSAAISHNYENYAIQTLDGKLYTGLLMSETEDKVILKSSEGVPREFDRDDIDEMQRLKMSLMPADLVKPMSEQDLVDLVEYLVSLKKAP